VGTLSSLAYKNQRGGNQKQGGKILEKEQRTNVRGEEKKKRKPEGQNLWETNLKKRTK
jgi:hypothetical protein